MAATRSWGGGVDRAVILLLTLRYNAACKAGVDTQASPKND